MKTLQKLFSKNREWAARVNAADPTFFKNSATEQAPKILWIGCADSRVPANEIVDLPSGELFVHRNVANLVIHTDFNCLSVLQYAVERLKVEHVIVCGHYGCGGVKAASEPQQLGLIDNWLRHIRDVYSKYDTQLANLSDEKRLDRLCELNVIEQVYNVCHTTIAQHAWQNNQPLSVHGWIYSMETGLLKDLGVTIDSIDEIEPIYSTAHQRSEE